MDIIKKIVDYIQSLDISEDDLKLATEEIKKKRNKLKEENGECKHG